MARLRTAMDAGFWDLNVASPRNLDGRARAVPGEPFPLDGSRASRAHRVQQLSLLGYGFPLGLIPSLSPPARKELGSFCLQSLLVKASMANWWLGLVGQFRPKKLISLIKSEMAVVDEWELSTFQDMGKHVLDKSLFSVGMFSRIPVTSSSSLTVNLEAHGDRKGHNYKLVYIHELSDYDITLEAAWPELFVDNKGKYWNVPESISLDLASLETVSGLSYRFGIHKNSGHLQALNATDADAPSTLLPGLWAKAAVSYKRTKDFWRQKETWEDLIIKTEKGTFRLPAYDEQLKEPHSTLSSIIGGAFGAGFGRKESVLDSSVKSKMKMPLFADLFGSMCYTFQHGKFRKLYGDLTRVDARLDICSASAFAESLFGLFSTSSNVGLRNPASSPRLGLTFQQQVAGPIVFRIDTKCAINSPRKQFVQVEDIMYSLNYALRLLGSGKVVAWYSPRRKEGMIELRLNEF